MLNAGGFSCVLLLDGVKQDLSRHRFEDGNATHVSATVFCPSISGASWELAWKDDRSERSESIGQVSLREHPTSHPRVISTGVRFRPGDKQYPTAMGRLETQSLAIELRLVLRMVTASGLNAPAPLAVFSFAIASARQQSSVVAPKTLYETGGWTPFAPQVLATPASLQPTVSIRTFSEPPGEMVTSAMSSGSSQPHSTPAPAQQGLLVQLEQSQRIQVELIKRLKVEQDSGNFYEAAVGRLYARLSPRQLVAYLDHRLATEDLSASMRVSIAIAKLQAVERKTAEDTQAVEHEVMQMLRHLTGTASRSTTVGGSVG